MDPAPPAYAARLPERLPERLQALQRLATAVAAAHGDRLLSGLLTQLARGLGVRFAAAAAFADGTRGRMRTLAAVVDGEAVDGQACSAECAPCFGAGAEGFRYAAEAGAAEFAACSALPGGLRSFAACPLRGGDGEAIGVLLVADGEPVAGGDASHAEAMMAVVAARLVAEVERERGERVLQEIAVAVSRSRSDSACDELVQLMATVLGVEVAFVARFRPEDPGALTMLSMFYDGQLLHDVRYALRGTPCETVLGQRFAIYPERLQSLFPDDHDAKAQSTQSYAGHPLTAADGSPLGIVSVASRRPMARGDRIEALLKIFAVRAGAEIDRLMAREALDRSEASYRSIFDASQDAILVLDWDSGRILDVNSKACETYGYSRDELLHLGCGDLVAPDAGYSKQRMQPYFMQARLGRSPTFEWHRLNKDGSLHWDEVHLKPAVLGGRPHVVAFTREITDRRQALEQLQLREEQYRAIFEASSDGLFLWNADLEMVDVNPAGLAMYRHARDEVIGRGYSEELPRDYVSHRVGMLRRAMEGTTTHVESRALRADGTWFDAELRVMPFRHRGQPHALAVVRDISDRLRRERELQRSEGRLRATVEAAFDCIISMDGAGRIIEFNAAAERVFGHRREDVLGQLLADTILPARFRVAHARGIRNFHAGAPAAMVGRLVETSALRADGSEFPVELAISVAAVPEGNIFVGHLRDITERQRAERALRDSEEQYRGIFNASADALVLRAADFSVVDVNAAYEKMSGYARAEALGARRVLANPPEVMDAIRALHEQALAGTAVAMDTQLVRRDGRRYDLELHGVPIRHRGQPHVLYIGRDITERKQAERALRDSEEQYRAIFNASADALVLRDAAFRTVEVNPAYTSVTGYTREEVLTADHVLTQPDGAVRAQHRAEHELALQGRALRFEVAGLRKDGSVVQLEVRATPIAYRGQPHVLYAARDITERQAAERRRAELERQLRQAQKMEAIGQLTGGLAHDFNNILTSVLGYVVMAQERSAGLDDAALARQLGQARLGAERARDHVAQLLAFSRPRSGERRLLAPSQLARQALELLRPSLPSSIVVEHAGAGAAPEIVVPPVVADPVQLEQVLFNLCINARDAIGGHGTIRLRIGHSAGQGHCASCSAPLAGSRWVWVEVADDGQGMPQEVIERMFEPFFTTKEVGRGTGMGLAMVHGIVHDHAGHIEVASTPGCGSTFRVLLPPAAQPSPADDQALQPAAAAGAAPLLRGRVLLVEDDAMVSDYMLDVMGGWGLDVVLERGPLAAARRLSDSAQAFDLLVTDQTMPGMSGLALARHARQHRPDLPVLLYTGNPSGLGAEELADCGVTALLRKPIDGTTLRPLLEGLLERGPAAAEPAKAG